jgi:hypothetical protein
MEFRAARLERCGEQRGPVGFVLLLPGVGLTEVELAGIVAVCFGKVVVGLVVALGLEPIQ